MTDIEVVRRAVDELLSEPFTWVTPPDVVGHGGVEHRLDTNCDACLALARIDEVVDRLEAERDRLREFYEAYEAADRGEGGAFERFTIARNALKEPRSPVEMVT